MVFFQKWLQNHFKFLLHFLIHIDVLKLCSKFELIPTSIFRVTVIFKNEQKSEKIPVCDIVFRRIALLTADKLNKPYTSVINFIRCKLSFSILRSTIRCVRGTRRSIYRPSDCDIDVAISDARLQCH